MDNCMVNRKESSLQISGFNWSDFNAMNELNWRVWEDGLNRDCFLMRRKRSSQDGHSIFPVESIIEMTTKEMRSRIQGIADSHDSSPTLRLSEESKNRRQNQQIISFHKRIHRLIQHHKRSQPSKQHTLWIENPFCFQEVAFIRQQRLSFTSTMSKCLTHPFHISFGP